MLPHKQRLVMMLLFSDTETQKDKRPVDQNNRPRKKREVEVSAEPTAANDNRSLCSESQVSRIVTARHRQRHQHFNHINLRRATLRF